MEIQTGWVAPPTLAGGLDHIGIQQLPVRIFSTLLPGLTVVTDRVANYSFYPWVSWVHFQSAEQTGLDFIHFLRRAECLLTLIAERHAATTGESERLHSQGLVGRNSLTKLVKPDAPRPIEFGPLAALRSENEGSYFKNRYGGLGQYYLGPLRDLGVLHRVGDRVEVSEDLGLPLATAFEERVDRAEFIRVLVQGHASDAELDALASFCPCHLAGSTSEREQLLDLLLARQGDGDEAALLRRQSFLLLLELSDRRGTEGDVPLDEAFKAACLTGALDSGETWTVPDSWRRVVKAWGTYERNDLLSVATLGVFWVALRSLDDRRGIAAHSREVGSWVTQLAQDALGELASTPLAIAIQQTKDALAPLNEWQREDHEFQVANRIRPAAEKDHDSGCLRASSDVLLALAARHLHPHPYVEAGVPADYLRDYPLNLNRFAASLEGPWAGLSVAEWLGELAASWGIESHLRVALRKLHHESKDTFLVRMTDEGLRRPPDGKEPPVPSFTASRLDRAVQFAVDLGLADWQTPGASGGGQGQGDSEEPSGSGWIARISDRGRAVLEELRG